MFNLRFCNAATILYSQVKFGHMHLCGMDYEYFSPHCCKCNSLGCTAAIRRGCACHGPHSDSVYSGTEHSQFTSPRLVKCEGGFPNQGGRWFAQTNYDALMTHHTTENTPFENSQTDCKIKHAFSKLLGFFNDLEMFLLIRWYNLRWLKKSLLTSELNVVISVVEV